MPLALHALAASLFLAGIVFVPAGTLHWPRGWAFLILILASTAALGAWLGANDPALLEERQKSALGGNQAPSDRAIMAGIFLCFLLWLILMPLDARRFHWSHLPAWTMAAGAVLEACAYLGWAWVVRTNTYAIPQIRLQPERGQKVITTGPYAVVRHPMYLFALLFIAGAPLLLGAAWGLPFLPAFALLLAARIHGEEAMLSKGLPGYAAYQATGPSRLIPGIW